MSIGIVQASGWWPSLVQAECSECSWRGPVRSLDEPGARARLYRDEMEHEQECGQW